MHLHFLPEEQVLPGCSGRTCCVPSLIKPLTLWVCCETRWYFTRSVWNSPLSRAWAQTVPVVQHQMQTYSPGGLTPRSSDMVRHSGLFSCKPSRSVKSAFSNAQYLLNTGFLLQWFCLALLRWVILKTLPRASRLNVLNTLHAYECQWEMRDISGFFILFFLKWN